MPGVTADRTPGHPTAGRPSRGLELAPFRGVRFDLRRIHDIAKVTAPPYDVIEPEERAALETADPHNIVRLVLPRSGTADPEERYRRAAGILNLWLTEGILVPDAGGPALYVYEQRSGGTLQRGLIGALGLRDPGERVVLPHEDVLAGPVADRLGLMRATEANLEPILMRYEGGGPASDAIDRVSATPPLFASDAVDGSTHRLWRLDDEEALTVIAADLADRQALIADGHHRYATYLRLQAERRAAGDGPGPWDYGLALLVDATRHPLGLHAIHRVVTGLEPERAARLAARHARVDDVSGATVDAALERLDAVTGPAVLLGGGERHWLVHEVDPALVDELVPHDRPEAWRRLDATVLDRLVIPHVWGVPNPAESVSYHHAAGPAMRLADAVGGTAVLMRATDVGTVLFLARQGVRMPRKSTSFWPKPRSGFVLRTFSAG